MVAASLASLKAACIPAVVNKLGNGFVIKNTLIKVNIFIKIIDNFIKNCSCVNILKVLWAILTKLLTWSAICFIVGKSLTGSTTFDSFWIWALTSTPKKLPTVDNTDLKSKVWIVTQIDLTSFIFLSSLCNSSLLIFL